MAMFQIKSQQIKDLEKDLGYVSEKAVSYATRNTLNQAAFIGMRISKRRVSKKMVLRNKWTQKSIRVDKAKGLDINRQEAFLGSTEGYMQDQEFGGFKRRKGREGVPIPTGTASGEGNTPRPRKRVPRRPNQIKFIRLRKLRRRVKNKRQELLVKVHEAINSGDRIIYHDFGGRKKKGIFKVKGGRKRSTKRGWPKGARLKMLHSLDKSSVRIPRNPWLSPSVDKTIRYIPGLYTRNLRDQFKRLKTYR